MYWPFASNSKSCAAAGAYAGPVALLDRVNTKTCPLELTATPGTSPKFTPGGSLKKSGTESNANSGTFCCANSGTAKSRVSRQRQVFSFISVSQMENLDCVQ